MQVAGGKDESVTQPAWTPNNELLFISDRTGWWNIYKLVSPTKVTQQACKVTSIPPCLVWA